MYVNLYILKCMSLLSAIHPVHGLAWTEGKSIYLTPINIYKGHVINEEHSKLGEFE